MAKEMLINVSEGEECRIALLEDGRLEELYMERPSATSHVGNIYKGRVTNVEPSIQAAFIDFGLGRNGFLHISDLMPTYFSKRGDEFVETVGRKMARRDRPPIQRCLRRGDDIVVQIIKEGIGTKGPTLTTYLSIPGRILVMMPGMANKGVSKKIEDDQERRRLRQILDGLQPPDDCGFIIRTAGVGKTKLEIERDLKYLARLWETLKKKRDAGPGPTELYTEGDLVTRTVRDVFTSDIDRIVVDNKEVAKRVKEVIKITAPRTRNKVDVYDDLVPLFHQAGIEREIEMIYSRHVPLPSGGSLVIDTTEAVVAIDVNSGKFREHADAETTAFKTDMEAADEIPRQLKLRDLGGVIICDFIDLRYERHRRELEARLHENFKNDRAKTKVLRMSQFGIIELTRQRMRPSLKRSIYFDCPHCRGAGLVKTPESMSLDVMRRLAIAANDVSVIRIELAVCPDVAFYLLNRKRGSLTDLESAAQKQIVVRQDTNLALDEMKLRLYDSRDNLLFLKELGMDPSDESEDQQAARPGRHQSRQDRGRDRQGRQHHAAQPPLPRRENDGDALFEDAEDLEDADASAEGDSEGEPRSQARQNPAREEDRPEMDDGDQAVEGPRDNRWGDNRNRGNRGRDDRPDIRGRDNRGRDNRPQQGNRSQPQRADQPARRDDGRAQPPHDVRPRRDAGNESLDRNRSDRDPVDSDPNLDAPLGDEIDGSQGDEREQGFDGGEAPASIGGRFDRDNPGPARDNDVLRNDGQQRDDRPTDGRDGDEQGQQSDGTGRRRRRRRGRGRGGRDRFDQVQPFNAPATNRPATPDAVENVVETDIDYGDEPVPIPPRNLRPAPARPKAATPPPATDLEVDESSGPGNERIDPAGEGVSEEGKRPRRRRRGGRGRRGRGRGTSEQGNEAEASDDTASVSEGDLPTPVTSETPDEISGNRSDEAPEDAPPARPRRQPRPSRAVRTTDAPPPREPRSPRGGRSANVANEPGEHPSPNDDSPARDDRPPDIRPRDARSRESRPINDRSRGAQARDAQTPAPPSGKESASDTRADASSRTPIPLPEVTRTGSTDKHLADDEPIDEPPVARVRSRRDLDALPEDYD